MTNRALASKAGVYSRSAPGVETGSQIIFLSHFNSFSDRSFIPGSFSMEFKLKALYSLPPTLQMQNTLGGGPPQPCSPIPTLLTRIMPPKPPSPTAVVSNCQGAASGRKHCLGLGRVSPNPGRTCFHLDSWWRAGGQYSNRCQTCQVGPLNLRTSQEPWEAFRTEGNHLLLEPGCYPVLGAPRGSSHPQSL